MLRSKKKKKNSRTSEKQSDWLKSISLDGLQSSGEPSQKWSAKSTSGRHKKQTKKKKQEQHLKNC